jgi:hypothetical protein
MPGSGVQSNAGKVMARKPIEWQTLEPVLRTLKKDALLQVLRAAYESLPASRVGAVFGAYMDPTTREASTPARTRVTPHRLLEAVHRFHAASLAGHYYESFRVNSRNFMEKSEGTKRWIRECNQFFEQCITLSRQGHHAEVRMAMDLLFALLEQIDTGSDDIIFFADEAGSWQVGIDDEKVLPVYLRSLAAVAEPEEYAARAKKVIEGHGAYNAETFFKAARKAANAAQRAALQRAASSR